MNKEAIHDCEDQNVRDNGERGKDKEDSHNIYLKWKIVFYNWHISLQSVVTLL